MVVAPKAIEQLSHIKTVHVSTYQAASGAGAAAMDELYEQYRQVLANEPVTVEKFAYQLAFNLIPQIDVFTENGYTKEEMKMINETRKILNKPDLNITATAVRVPVNNCHGESINIEFENTFYLRDVIDILSTSIGVKVLNTPHYPMPINVSGYNDVFVGRIRRDNSIKNGLNLWVVADNIRKGAATNAVQILKDLICLK